MKPTPTRPTAVGVVAGRGWPKQRPGRGPKQRLEHDHAGVFLLGGTEVVIGASLLIGAVVVWRTRDWRLAAVPAIAILVETAIFLSIASLVDRERPPVEKLDVAPPTSSYPSGHVGASTALYLAFAILARRIERSWLRRTIFICLATPILVAFARLYRGMHYVTDVAAGLIAGIVSALLAYGWYHHRARLATLETATHSVPNRRNCK